MGTVNCPKYKKKQIFCIDQRSHYIVFYPYSKIFDDTNRTQIICLVFLYYLLLIQVRQIITLRLIFDDCCTFFFFENTIFVFA